MSSKVQSKVQYDFQGVPSKHIERLKQAHKHNPEQYAELTVGN